MKKLLIVIGVFVVLVVISAKVLQAGKKKMIAMVNKEVDSLFYSYQGNENKLISMNDLAHLPFQMQEYLKHCKVIGKESLVSVQLNQEAEIKLKRDNEQWSYHETKQYFNAKKPGFIWFAELPVAFLNFLVRDKLLNGVGEMYITIGGTIELGKETGTDMDNAGVARFMGECGWFPQCFVNDYYTWESIDSTSVKAILHFDGFTQEGIFTFNEQNLIEKFQCQRYCSWTNKEETYINYFKDYKEMDGVIIPSHGIAAYNINGEVIEYWRGDVIDIEYNKPIKYIESVVSD